MQGDTKALALWNELGSHIGNLIKTVLFTYDPQAIILGGDILNGYSFFAEKMHETISVFPFKNATERVNILLSKNENVNLLGAAALVV